MSKRTQTNNKIFTFAGKKNDGKTTLALYVLEQLNKPSVIFDVVKQFEANTNYRVVCKSIEQLSFYLFNPAQKERFYKAKTQLIFQPSLKHLKDEVEQVCELLYDCKDIAIFFDEYEMITSRHLSSNSSIYNIFYASRNANIDILAVIKDIGNFPKICKSQSDYFVLGKIVEHTARDYFNKKGGGKFEAYHKNLEFREFLFTDLDSVWKKIKLKKEIVKLIK